MPSPPAPFCGCRWTPGVDLPTTECAFHTPPAPFSRGDYVRVDGEVHVVKTPVRVLAWDGSFARWTDGLAFMAACGCYYRPTEVTPASGDEPRQCPRCREAT